MSFIKEFWEFLIVKKKIFTTNNYNCSSFVWWTNIINPGFGGSPIYLHYFLK